MRILGFMSIVKKWHLKAAVQKCISVMPGSRRLNLFFQKNVTGGVLLDDVHFAYKIGHAADHLEAAFSFFSDERIHDRNFHVLELGTGWYPVIPIAMRLAGVPQITTTDLSPHLNVKGFRDASRKIMEWYESGKLSSLFELKDQGALNIVRRLAEYNFETRGGGVEDLLREFHIQYIVGDARGVSVPDGYYDLIVSNNTFEHIYPDILKDILIEFKRIVKKDGMMSHFIDMSDHFAHFDRSISIYNFLKFSDSTWRLIDNNLQPQNRLRLRQYEDIYNELSIPNQRWKLQPGEPELVESMRLAHPFSSFTSKENAISHGYLLTQY